MDLFGNIPIYESPLVPAPKVVTTRREWIERRVVGGKVLFTFNHDLRHRGSEYFTRKEAHGFMFKFQGSDMIVVHSAYAALLGVHS